VYSHEAKQTVERKNCLRLSNQAVKKPENHPRIVVSEFNESDNGIGKERFVPAAWRLQKIKNLANKYENV
jgi:hypothetical protein